MKMSFVSSSAVSQALRYSLMRNQASLVTAQKEATTWRVADTGLALGARTSQSVSFNRELERMKGIVDTNALISSRLLATQSGLDRISDTAQSLLSTLTTSLAGETATKVAVEGANTGLETLNSVLNTSLNGEYLFAGINTDQKPANSFTDPASPAKAAYDAAYAQYLADTGANPADPFPGAADIDTFVTNYVEPLFMGAGWSNWSSASDQRISSRIALNEKTETSVTANNSGIRKLAMAATLVNELLGSGIDGPAQTRLVERAMSSAGEAMTDLTNLRAETGMTQTRVTAASERMQAQSDIFEKHLLKMEGVDPYEASTRVSELLGHIETSYALTARIQQLSLLKFMS